MNNHFMNLPKLPPIPHGQPYPLFTRISIETTKTCTRSCWFCSSPDRGHHKETMPDDLYTMICEQLADLRFEGVVQWFFLNEPLLDKQWEARIRQLRQTCSKVTIHLTTNWDLQWRKPPQEQHATIHRLFDAGVNSLNLNDYDARGYMPLVREAAALNGAQLVDHCWKKIGPNKRVISCGPLPEKLHSWSGYVSGDEVKAHGMKAQTGKKWCPRPMRHIVVQYDGRVPLCCAVNAAHAEVMGAMPETKLIDIWNSRAMFEYRAKLQDGIREGQCASCDAVVAYPSIVRRVSL